MDALLEKLNNYERRNNPETEIIKEIIEDNEKNSKDKEN